MIKRIDIDTFFITLITLFWVITFSYILGDILNIHYSAILVSPLFVIPSVWYCKYNKGYYFEPNLFSHEFKNIFIGIKKGALLGVLIFIIITILDNIALNNFLFFRTNSGKIITSLIDETFVAVFLMPIIIIMAFCEEYFFRGVLYKGLRKNMGVFLSATICSLIFTLLHNIGAKITIDLLYTQLSIFCISMTLCLFLEKQKLLSSVIIAHFVFNILKMATKGALW